MAIQLVTSVPGPKSVALMKRRQASVARGPFHATPIFVARAKGAVLEDVDGNRFLDFASGIGVVNVGHVQEELVRDVCKQAEKIFHASFNVTPYEGYVELAEKLNAITPGDFSKKTFLANSGAEAVENAIKIARTYTGRTAVICFDHAFHGRTYMAMSLTAKEKPYRAGFGPFNSDIHRAPFPYPYRELDVETCFRRFEEIVRTQAGVERTAAVILEPVLGEGGFIPAPKEFLSKLREFCTANGIVLIADEIQTGFGRTGTLLASEQLELVPDLITMAKGLGGGLPISAVTGRAEMMDAPIEGGIGGTYGGNPLACASALAVLRMFEEKPILSHARQIGERLKNRMQQWEESFPRVGNVRGLGPMHGFELVRDRATKEPDREATARLLKFCYEHGVVTLSAGTFGNVVRVLMPLTITAEELDEGLDVMEEGLKELK